MHAAKLDKSDRLRRVASLLKRHKKPLSTRDIIEKANVCAINSIISELRCNGYDIKCHRTGSVWYYWMVK